MKTGLIAGLAAGLLITAASLSQSVLRASEVDNFSQRDWLGQARDAQGVLDAEVNRILDHAVTLANRESPDRCNRVLLRQEILRWIGPDPVGLLELWATMTGDLQKTSVGFGESVYAGVSFKDSPAMHIFGIGRTFKLAGHVVGTDKLGHFFMQGLDYYKRVDSDGVSIRKVMRDENGEGGIWGLKATGVRSYGDMAANFSGYLFWKQLYQGDAPYMRCENNRQWVKTRVFAWSDYVNDAWDEAINCVDPLPEMRPTIERNMARMGVSCPLDRARCIAISQLENADLYVSPECLKLAKGSQAK